MMNTCGWDSHLFRPNWMADHPQKKQIIRELRNNTIDQKISLSGGMINKDKESGSVSWPSACIRHVFAARAATLLHHPG